MQSTIMELKEMDPGCRLLNNITTLSSNNVTFINAGAFQTSSATTSQQVSLTNNTLSFTDEMYLIFSFKLQTNGTGPISFYPGIVQNLLTNFTFQQSGFPACTLTSTSNSSIARLYNINKILDTDVGMNSKTSAMEDTLFISSLYPTNQGGPGVQVYSNANPPVVEDMLSGPSGSPYIVNPGKYFPANTTNNFQIGCQLKYLIPSVDYSYRINYGLLQFVLSYNCNLQKLIQFPITNPIANIQEFSLTKVDLLYTSCIMSQPIERPLQVVRATSVYVGTLPGTFAMNLTNGADTSCIINSNNLNLTNQKLLYCYAIPYIASIQQNMTATVTLQKPYAPLFPLGLAPDPAGVIIPPSDPSGINIVSKVLPVGSFISNGALQQYSSNMLGLPIGFKISGAQVSIGGSIFFPTNSTMFYDNNYFADFLNYYYTVIMHKNRASSGAGNNSIMDYSMYTYFKFLGFDVSEFSGPFNSQVQLKLTIENNGLVAGGGGVGSVQFGVDYILISETEIINSI